jgi:hypothetical protein
LINRENTHPGPAFTSLNEVKTMSTELATSPEHFVDRRSYDVSNRSPAFERRQFTNSYEELSPEALELARAIDGYKLNHRRRFITYEEMLSVVKLLGYKRS